MARWITFDTDKLPWDYKWPTVTAITAVTPNRNGKPVEAYVKDELADAAIQAGVAREGKAGATKPRKPAKPASDDAADPGQPDSVDRADLADADRADGEHAVDDAG